MRFGYFLSPYHVAGRNPTLSLQQDLDLGVLCDQLGFDEFWVGEHHSGGYEIISSPEVFLATLAERTRYIKLGTGVVSVPYHNPFHVASRIVLLDHLTRGRVMLGCGPGQLASDMHMLGLDAMKTRGMLAEGMDVIRRLLAGETVTHETDWFKLNDARLHLLPYSPNGIDMAVTGSVTATGATIAGTAGIGLLSMAATSPEGFKQLRAHWERYCQCAEGEGRQPQRSAWRVVGPMHIAETREKAEAEVAEGLPLFAKYFHHVTPGGLLEGKTLKELLKSNNERRFSVIGTPEDAIQRIQELADQSGGFGTYVLLGHDWANPEATNNSLRLIAEQVMPKFNGRADAQVASLDWCNSRGEEFSQKNARPMREGAIIPRAKDAAALQQQKAVAS